MTRKLHVFLCHASEDKLAVRELYKRLVAESWIEPWLDEENLLPGQDFDLTIYKAIRDTDAIIVCLSKVSVVKESYINKEIRRALDIADEKPEGTIYVIPLRLDDCKPSFQRLNQLHWVDYFKTDAHEKLVKSLRLRADALKIETSETKVEPVIESKPDLSDEVDLDLYKFIQIPATKDVPYSFYIGKYPVTNVQYERFLNAPDFSNPIYWLEFLKFNKRYEEVGNWGSVGWDWFQKQLGKAKSKVFYPKYWGDDRYGQINKENPVIGVSWYEACAFCEWLQINWNLCIESKANPVVKPQKVRLPLEIEWIVSAGGDIPVGRYPWDEPGKETVSLKEIVLRSNLVQSGFQRTVSVKSYPLGASTYQVMDMAGNVHEWQANYSDDDFSYPRIRGGSWFSEVTAGRVSSHDRNFPYHRSGLIGFRAVVIPSR